MLLDIELPPIQFNRSYVLIIAWDWGLSRNTLARQRRFRVQPLARRAGILVSIEPAKEAPLEEDENAYEGYGAV